MNCLDVRRALTTDPSAQTPALLEHIQSCDVCAAAFANSRRFEHGLREAVRVPVPENLASRILLRQSFEARRRTPRWFRWPKAMAAAVVLAVGLVIATVLTTRERTPELGQDVVELVRAAGYALAATGPVAPAEVRAALRPVGLGLRAELQNVTFASRCYLRGKLAGHLVLKGQNSPVSVFLIPSTLIQEEADINARDWSGKLLPSDRGTIAVVAAPGEPIEQVVQMVRGAVRWDA